MEFIMSDSDSFYRHIAQTSSEPMGLEIDYAEGCTLYTKDGKQFTDFISGIAVSSLGHRHPNVLKAIRDQIDKHLHVMVYGEYIQAPQSKFAKLLCDQLPGSLDRVYFVNSGTEAIEGALKLAKKHKITVNDLYSFALPVLSEIQRPENVHFTDEGSRRLGEKVAEVVLEVLSE